MWKYCLLLFCFCNACRFSMQAQTVAWSQPPTYQALEEYGDMYKVREQGKVGLVSKSGKILVRPEYDSITPFHEQLALGLEIQDDKYAVKAIIDQTTCRAGSVADKYYVQEEELYFSGGKLAVYDDSNRYGYLLPDGTLFIPCQYMRAYPFYEGMACVYKAKNRVCYLKSDGTELTTEVERQGYVLIAGTAFNESGEACVQGKLVGRKAFVINTQGKTLREAKFSGNTPKNFTFRKSFKFQNVEKAQVSDGVKPYKEGSLYGFVTSDGKKTILRPQFAEAYPFRNGFARVKLNGKYGILQLLPGDFAGQLDKHKVRFRNGKGEKVAYTVSVPPGYQGKPVTMTVSEGGKSEEIPLDLAGGVQASFSFVPHPVGEEKTMNIHVSLASEGLLLWEDNQTLALEYVKALPPVLSVPQVTSAFRMDSEGYIRADSENKVEVYATITNPSSFPLNITVTMEGEGLESTSVELTVPAESRRVVSTVIPDIKERKSVHVVARTSTGLEQDSVINVKPFI